VGLNIFSNKLRPIVVTVFLICGICSTTIAFILPEVFAGTARLQVRSSGAVSPDDFKQVLDSDAFLKSVVNQMDLKDVWGKKYNNGILAEDEAVKLLRVLVRTKTVSPDGILSITVKSGDAREAAQIANVMANGVRDFVGSNHLTGSDDSHPALRGDMVQVIEAAVPGKEPVQPNKPLIIGSGLVLGLLLGAGIAAAVGLLDKKTG
jgi:uncharacterized protein involved in exopolysaccharide biosynthesis